MVWDPAQITPRPWASAVEYYRGLEQRNRDFSMLREMCAHIAAQTYAGSIAGATSGTALLIARQVPADWSHEALRVDVNLAGAIRFTRPEKRPVRPSIFEREGKNAVSALEGFLHDAGWIAR
jgi:hypothetical protein